MIELKLLIIVLCAFLFWWGGFSFLAARRYMMPFCLGIGISFFSNVWWLGMAIMPVCGALCLGYGDNSPLRHVFGNGWARSVWGLLVATCLSLPLFLTHHIGASIGHLSLTPLLVLFFYMTLNFTLENALKNIPQIIGDPIIGAGFGLIVFLVCP